MFYRRKIILALLQILGKPIEKISLQKLLFLFSIKQKEAIYNFIPYKYGSYSFSLNADLSTMLNKAYISESSNYINLLITNNFIDELKFDDKELLYDTVALYGKMSLNELTKYTYINFPYWAINSVMAHNILNKDEYNKVLESKPYSDKTILFTIGYEGISLEEYLNNLIKNDVKLLVDVRKNPLSMKYGFSKTRLRNYCNSVGIIYEHFPEVGIKSELRKELNCQKDYDDLFLDYKKTQLPHTINTQKEIYNLLIKHKRIALSCFEANACQCHRKPLAESIKLNFNLALVLKHI